MQACFHSNGDGAGRSGLDDDEGGHLSHQFARRQTRQTRIPSIRRYISSSLEYLDRSTPANNAGTKPPCMSPPPDSAGPSDLRRPIPCLILRSTQHRFPEHSTRTLMRSSSYNNVWSRYYTVYSYIHKLLVI